MFRKIFSLLLCIMMISSLMMCAFADEVNGFSNDINDIDASLSNNDGKLQLNISGITDVSNDQTTLWDKLFTQYRGIIVGLSGIGAITMIVFFIINFMKLGASAGNPQMRTQSLVGIIWTGLAAAGLGGVTLFVGFFYNVLKG